MNIVVASCNKSIEFKEIIKLVLENEGINVIDRTLINDSDIINATERVCNDVLNGIGEKGIIIDEYGALPFIVASKHKGIICAQLADEHSAKMTRDHNNTSIITIGSKVTGIDIAKSIVTKFINSDYSGGRHQIRVDMLNKMC